MDSVCSGHAPAHEVRRSFTQIPNWTAVGQDMSKTGHLNSEQEREKVPPVRVAQ